MVRWNAEQRAFLVETYFKNSDTVTQNNVRLETFVGRFLKQGKNF